MKHRIYYIQDDGVDGLPITGRGISRLLDQSCTGCLLNPRRPAVTSPRLPFAPPPFNRDPLAPHSNFPWSECLVERLLEENDGIGDSAKTGMFTKTHRCLAFRVLIAFYFPVCHAIQQLLRGQVLDRIRMDESDSSVSDYHKKSPNSRTFPPQFTNFLFQFTNYHTKATMAKSTTALALLLALYVTTAQHVGPGATACANVYPTPTLSALSPLPGHLGAAALPLLTEASAPDWLFVNDSLIFLANVLFSFFFVVSLAEAVSTLGLFLLSVPFKVVYIVVRFLFAGLKNVRPIFSSLRYLFTDAISISPSSLSSHPPLTHPIPYFLTPSMKLFCPLMKYWL